MSLPIAQRLGHHVKRVEQELICQKTAVLKPHGLNPAQYTALLALSQEPGLSGAGLARRCLVTPQAVSSLLVALEARGLVERRPHPLHEHVLETRLTKTGEALLAKADADASAVEERLGSAFDKAETDQFLAYLARCSEVFAEINASRA
ncbi:MarR family transcriptional regulator [Solihabitans fulvus]|uniref:MarR family transcriptional regulator n=1 Tax=Solihabitans fulvus TaxID=1892852 RepID=A0A5B2WSM6_9PSEU|nr:MarR family transcriptional regulator [Solihabitans fulvus]KAA2253830.1 MarR family transcriptional regulator [Solihabitans fulvus]